MAKIKINKLMQNITRSKAFLAIIMLPLRACARANLSGKELINKTVDGQRGNTARVTATTPTPKDVSVCEKCCYVLLRKDAVISGRDSEGSSTQVHRPRCGKTIARYIK